MRGIRLTGAGVNKQALRATGGPDHVPPGDDSWVAGEEPYVSLHVLSDATPPAPAIARARSLPSSSTSGTVLCLEPYFPPCLNGAAPLAASSRADAGCGLPLVVQSG